MKVLFLAAKQLMQRWVYRKTYFIKWQSLTLSTLWSLAPTCSFYGPDHNLNIPLSIFHIKREKTETLKGHEIRGKRKGFLSRSGTWIGMCDENVNRKSFYLPRKGAPFPNPVGFFFLSRSYLAAINVVPHWFKHVLSQWSNPRYRILPLWESN